MRASEKFHRRAAPLIELDSVRIEYNSTGIGNGGVRVQFNSWGERLTMFMSVEEARQLATSLLVAIQNDGEVTTLGLQDGSSATLKVLP